MKRTATALAAGAALLLTGCGPSTVDTVDPDAPRAEKDEVFTTYLRDTYGDTYPDMEETIDELPQMPLWVCSMLDDGMPASASVEALGLNTAPKREQDMLKDTLYQGTRVYCPQHTDSLEYMNVRGHQ